MVRYRHLGSWVWGVLRSGVKEEPAPAGGGHPRSRAPRARESREIYERSASRAKASSRKRKTRRCTLPVVVIGKASMNSMSFGYS